MTVKERLDNLLVRRGFVPDLNLAQRMVMAGQVRVSDQVVYKPATMIPADSQVHIIERPRYVSRGGEKLEAALKAFDLDVNQRICADVGASTGGFTDCLLQHGAKKVYAIDVGQGILEWKLRQDARVVVMENTNARLLEKLPQPVSLVTIDASFISLKTLLPVVEEWNPESYSEGIEIPLPEILALIKPQFEADRAQVNRGRGIIRDPDIHRQVLQDVLNFALHRKWQTMGLIASPLLGAKGNREFLVWLKQQDKPVSRLEDFLDAVTK